MLQLANINHRLVILDEQVQARRRRWEWALFLARPSFTEDGMLQFGRYVQLMRELMMKDSFHLHENETKHV